MRDGSRFRALLWRHSVNDVAARSELRRTRGRARGSSFESSTFFEKFVLDKEMW